MSSDITYRIGNMIKVAYHSNGDKQLTVWNGEKHILILTTTNENEIVSKSKAVQQMVSHCTKVVAEEIQGYYKKQIRAYREAYHTARKEFDPTILDLQEQIDTKEIIKILQHLAL